MYDLYKKQISLFIQSSDGIGSANDFSILIPNIFDFQGEIPQKLYCQIITFNTNRFNSTVGGVEVPSIQLRSDLGITNSFESQSKTNSQIICQVDRYDTGILFWNYKAYDKTFMSFCTGNFFNGSVRFYVTDNNGNPVTGLTYCNFVMNVFWD
jgi:hypothetical protein